MYRTMIDPAVQPEATMAQAAMAAAVAPNTALNPPTALVAAVPTTVSRAKAISAAVAHLEALPNSSSPVAPHLAAHITTAKAHGKQWQTTTLPQVQSALAAVTEFGSSFDAHYAGLVSAAKKLPGGGAEAVTEFKAQLTYLQAASVAASAKAASAQSGINAFEALVAGDGRLFAADTQSAAAAAHSAEALAHSAEAQLRQLEAERAAKQKELEAMLILGPLAWAIEALINAITGKIGAQQKALVHAQQQLVMARQAQAAAQQAVAVAGQYSSTASSIGSAVASMMSGWQVLDGNFKTLIESENITAFNVFTQDVLAGIQADWNNLASQAKTLG